MSAVIVMGLTVPPSVCLSVCVSHVVVYAQQKQTNDDAVFTKRYSRDASFWQCKNVLQKFKGSIPSETVFYTYLHSGK